MHLKSIFTGSVSIQAPCLELSITEKSPTSSASPQDNYLFLKVQPLSMEFISEQSKKFPRCFETPITRYHETECSVLTDKMEELTLPLATSLNITRYALLIAVLFGGIYKFLLHPYVL